MAGSATMQHPHWEYLAALCEDFERIARFVEPCHDNWQTYSVEFTRLYLGAGSEVDVVAEAPVRESVAWIKAGGN
jgi:hypothetical protein